MSPLFLSKSSRIYDSRSCGIAVMDISEDLKDDTPPDLCPDQSGWVHVPGPQSVVYLDTDDEDDNNNNNNGPLNNGPLNNGPLNNGPLNNSPPNNVPQPGDLSRAICEGKLRDSFDIATCPRVSRLTRAAANTQKLAADLRELSLALDRLALPLRGKDHPRATEEDSAADDNLGGRDALNNPAEPDPPRGEWAMRPLCLLSLQGDFHWSNLDVNGLYREGVRDRSTVTTTTTTAPGPEEPEQTPAPVVAEENDETADTGRKKPAKRSFSMSAIKGRIKGMVRKDKSKPKPNGAESATLEQPQNGGILYGEKQRHKIFALGEDKDKVVVSVEPVEPSSDEEEPEKGPCDDDEWDFERGPVVFLGEQPWEEDDGEVLLRRTRSAGL